MLFPDGVFCEFVSGPTPEEELRRLERAGQGISTQGLSRSTSELFWVLKQFRAALIVLR
jgi:hypothetical protein